MMKKTTLYKSIQLLIIVFFISCTNKNNGNLTPSLTYEFETIDNDFNLFSGNTLIQDTNDLNYIYFYSANTEKINFVKKDTLYPFDIIKINQLLNQDVINFYEIQLTELSELKKKVLFESENFESKKDSLSKLEHNLLNTLFCFQKKYDCNDKYSLEINSFDLTSILDNNGIKWSSEKLIYTPKDEETALYIEDNCNEIYINLFARLEKKDISEKLSFDPLRVELFNSKFAQKIIGTCSFQQSSSTSSLPENIKLNKNEKKNAANEVTIENAEEITIYLENKSEMDRHQNVIQNTKLSNSSLSIKLEINKSSEKDYLEFFPKNINIKGRYYVVSTSRNDNTKVRLFNLANKNDNQIQLSLDLKNKYAFITYNVSNDGMYYENVVGGKYSMK